MKTTSAPFPTALIQAPTLRWQGWQQLQRGVLLGTALGFFAIFLLLPLLAIFVEALRRGVQAYQTAVMEPEALRALLLSLQVLAWVVPLNTIFGLSAAWTLSKFEFRGKRCFLAFIDLPFAVSPVVAGLTFMLLFGQQGWWGDWLKTHDIQILFAFPSMVLATLFVSLPFVVRQILPLMDAQGNEAEEAALLLGANGWQCFFLVTLPRIRWALLHGIVLCGARALGEFGAVSVVSGHIRGLTNTLPLHVEILYNEYQFVAAFAVASLLALCSLVTLGCKAFLERQERALAQEYRDAS